MVLSCNDIMHFFYKERRNRKGREGLGPSSRLPRILRGFIPAALAAVMLLQVSCITTPVTVSSSTTPMHDKKITSNNGRVQGSHRAWSVFGLWMVGRPDIDLAIQDALKKNGGDALINVTCYEKTAWFFFVSSHTVIVEGEAVTLSKEAPDADKDKKNEKGKRKK